MIDTALTFLKDELEVYLHTHGMDSNLVHVVLSNLVDDGGKYALQRGDVAICLFNIEEERIFKSHAPDYVYIDGQHITREPALKLNLHIVIAAYFQFYDQALKVISIVLTYFQSHPQFTVEAFPALDSRIEKLVVELQSLNYEQLNQMWAFIGGKQLPSAVYKVKLVVLQEEVSTSIRPPIHIINAEIGGR